MLSFTVNDEAGSYCF